MKLPLINRLPRETRIVLIVIVGIVLPSLALTFFAFHAVGNERLVVQTQQDRHFSTLTQMAAAGLSARCSDALNKARAAAVNAADLKSLIRDARRLRNENRIFKFSFIADGAGSVVYPAVVHPSPPSPLPDVGLEAFDKAHQWEFKENRYDRAKAAYDDAFREYAGDRALEIAAKSGAARNIFKSNQYRNAADEYGRLLEKYFGPGEEDSAGESMQFRLQYSECLNKLDDERAYYRSLLDAYDFLISRGLTMDAGRFSFYEKIIRNKLESLAGPPTRSTLMEEMERCKTLFARFSVLEKEMEFARSLREELEPFVKDKAAALRPAGEFVSRREGNSRQILALFTAGKTPEKLSGILGFELDLDYLRRELAPRILAETAGGEPVFFVLTESGRTVASTRAPSPDAEKRFAERLAEPLDDFAVVLMLPRSAMAGEITSIRSTIYFWVVAISIVGIIGGVIFTVRTVNREIKLAQLQTDFVSNVTHELKTPLTSIQMFVETLQEDRVKHPGEREECLNIIASESRRLSRLIDRVLDFSRLEAGSKSYSLRPASVPEVVKKSIEALRQQLEEERVELHLRIPRKVSPALMDPDAVAEVILNLLTNAVKYSAAAPKGVWLTIRESKTNIIVDVVDKGIGVSRWELKKIFEKFYRSDNRLAREIEGTGLGLTISRHIARAHGGDILVASRKNQGSRFSLVLKKAAEDKAQPAAEASGAPPEPKSEPTPASAPEGTDADAADEPKAEEKK
jgi:signal transduction histidine kinase